MTLIEPLLQQPGFVPDLDSEKRLHESLSALPVAAYTTDAAGRITFYNEAAAALWGCGPILGSDKWCGSWRLFWPDGTPLPHDQSPMAMAINEKRAIAGMEAVAERPDGTRVSFMPFPSPMLDSAGNVMGAVNMLVDISERKKSEEIAQRLAAIVESSDDAIVSKDLNGIITSWNRGAERIFGYSPEEAIGKPITILIPADRQSEEAEIIGRIRRGQRVEHFETVRRRKHGSLIDISLTVSPVRDAAGKIIGASKIARDITERRRAEQQTRRLQDISTRLIQEGKDNLYDAILDAAVSLMRSDMATMQMFDASKGQLRLLGARGFDPASIGSFEWVGHDAGTSCAAALRAGRRVILPDIDKCDFIVGTPAYEALRKCGIRAAQSTPLMSRSGVLIGMITNHWREPHEPLERDLLLIDVLARQAADLIERKHNEDRIVILAREAEHRAKNVLATVQATVRLTTSDTPEALKLAIEGRIQALANVHRLFVESSWVGADLQSVVRQELAPYCQDGETRALIDGPNVLLVPSMAQTIAIALHELATNAAKYGALSVPQGRVQVQWSRAAGETIVIRWTETGGPPVKQPHHRGFGTRVMDRMIRGELNATMRFDWRADGLACEIILPGVKS